MNTQIAIDSIKRLLPLPRVLLIIRWLAIGLLCVSIGILTAGIVENHVLKIPFQTDPFIPALKNKVDRPRSIDEFEPIITYNVFDAEVSSSDLTEQIDLAVSKPGKNLKQILSGLQLVGISILQGRYAVCVIKENKGNREEIFSVNDPVFRTGAFVKKIQIDLREQKVYLQLRDEIGVLTYKVDLLNQHRPISSLGTGKSTRKSGRDTFSDSNYSTDGKNFHISAGEVDAQLDNFAQLLNQAKMVPYFRKGQHRGYQVKAINKNSLYQKLGLKNNDVIEEINGEPLDSMEKVMGMFNKFRNEREFTIKLNRKGSSQFMNYYID